MAEMCNMKSCASAKRDIVMYGMNKDSEQGERIDDFVTEGVGQEPVLCCATLMTHIYRHENEEYLPIPSILNIL